ncbi:DsrE family protein [Telmatospirillum sp.]|uniref:DsrE family protein n=1 Tax=Telmatospirillum sp. TaxID=2079197 RepID=UPI0028411017|nr:DsrE family protein [Telmatospirillum sp.]MDR3437538.1 DsrE family protein [Telmatospirillum sp.]
MSAAEPPVDGPGGPEKLSLVLFSGSFDKVHYALAMAAAALASNRQATLFFTMGAARALLAEDAEGPGWRRLHATEEGLSPLAADAELTARGLGNFEELLSACVALGGTVMVCEMGLRALGLTPKALRTDVPVTQGGLVSFLADASASGAMVFV